MSDHWTEKLSAYLDGELAPLAPDRLHHQLEGERQPAPVVALEQEIRNSIYAADLLMGHDEMAMNYITAMRAQQAPSQARGSIQVRPIRRSQCRWLPVERPVEPTSPRRSPAATCRPGWT